MGQAYEASANWSDDIRFALGASAKGTALMMTVIGAVVMTGVNLVRHRPRTRDVASPVEAVGTSAEQA